MEHRFAKYFWVCLPYPTSPLKIVTLRGHQAMSSELVRNLLCTKIFRNFLTNEFYFLKKEWRNVLKVLVVLLQLPKKQVRVRRYVIHSSSCFISNDLFLHGRVCCEIWTTGTAQLILYFYQSCHCILHVERTPLLPTFYPWPPCVRFYAKWGIIAIARI